MSRLFSRLIFVGNILINIFDFQLSNPPKTSKIKGSGKREGT